MGKYLLNKFSPLLNKEEFHKEIADKVALAKDDDVCETSVELCLAYIIIKPSEIVSACPNLLHLLLSCRPLLSIATGSAVVIQYHDSTNDGHYEAHDRHDPPSVFIWLVFLEIVKAF